MNNPVAAKISESKTVADLRDDLWKANTVEATELRQELLEFPSDMTLFRINRLSQIIVRSLRLTTA